MSKWILERHRILGACFGIFSLSVSSESSVVVAAFELIDLRLRLASSI